MELCNPDTHKNKCELRALCPITLSFKYGNDWQAIWNLNMRKHCLEDYISKPKQLWVLKENDNQNTEYNKGQDQGDGSEYKEYMS